MSLKAACLSARALRQSTLTPTSGACCRRFNVRQGFRLRFLQPRRSLNSLGLAEAVLTFSRASAHTASTGSSDAARPPAPLFCSEDTYDVDRHVAAASDQLQHTFGPHARLVLSVLRQRKRFSVDDDVETRAASRGQSGDSGAEPATYCRASATFRLLAFPVELAAVKSTQPDEAIEQCVRQALSSDVEFLMPQRRQRGQQQQLTDQKGIHDSANASLATMLPQLRDLCIFFSRSVKFSIKPPRVAVAAQTGMSSEPSDSDASGNAWRCRAYVRDEWDATRHARLAVEGTGDSPRAALTDCAKALLTRYSDERTSPVVALGGAHELSVLLTTSQGKKVVEARSDPEDTQSTTPTRTTASAKVEVPHTVSSLLRIQDGRENTRVIQLRRQPSPTVGLHTAAMLAIKSEACWDASVHLYSARLPTVPLLTRLRWQFDVMVQHLSQALQKPAASIARVEVIPLGVSLSASTGGQGASGGEEAEAVSEGSRAVVSFAAPHLYRAVVICEDAPVWQATSGGRYRVELDAYAQAVLLLLDQYGCCVSSVRAQPGLLYPSAALLELALTRHDQLNIHTHHRGNWTGYAVLGTLTSQLLGGYYQTQYLFDPTSKYWKATLTVPNGRETDSILIERLSLQKGEAWRHACLDALRENFPNQYAAAVAKYPEMDFSAELISRGGRYRALPRHKRVRHIGNLFDLVSAFAEEDFGWRQLRVRLRNVSGHLGLPQWVAEMEAMVDTEAKPPGTTAQDSDSPRSGGAAVVTSSSASHVHRVVVAESPAFTQVKVARRVLVYRMAARYFPNELAIYKTLGRADGNDPEESLDASTTRTCLFEPSKGAFITQLLAAWTAEHPTLAPFSWDLAWHEKERHEGSRRSESDEAGNNRHVRDGQDAKDEMHTLTHALEPLRPPCHVQVYGKGGEVLIRDEESRSCASPSDAAPLETSLPNVVTALMAALKHATAQLDVAPAERLLRAYETHSYPPLQTSRELCLYLFSTFFGPAAGRTDDHAWGASADGSSRQTTTAQDESDDFADLLSVECVQCGDYWFATVRLPRVRHAPLAKAVHSTKRGSGRDALLLATRNAFRPHLEHLLGHSITLSALAEEVLHEPVVQVLPDPVRQEMVSDARRRQQRALQQQQQRAPQIHALIHRVQDEFSGTRRLRIQQTQPRAESVGAGEYACRIYLDPTAADTGAHSPSARAVPHVVRGQTQLVGEGAGKSEADALQMACVEAFHRLFGE